MKIISNREVSQLPVELRLYINAKALVDEKEAKAILKSKPRQQFVQFVYKHCWSDTDYNGHRRHYVDNYLIRYYRDGYITIGGDAISVKDSRKEKFTLKEAIEFCYRRGAKYFKISSPSIMYDENPFAIRNKLEILS